MASAILLMYHDLVDEDCGAVYSVHRKVFEQHLRLVSECGATVQTLDEFLSAPADRAIVITFDDGNVSNLLIAAPLLSKFNFRGTFFLTTGFIGARQNFMTWQEVRELYACGMELGTHGHTHRFLTDLEDPSLERELLLPLEIMLAETGASVRHMSAPGGRLDDRVLRHAWKAGYRTMSSSMPGINSNSVTDQCEFGRFAITQKTSIETFRKIIQFESLFIQRQAWLFHSKHAAKQLIGNKIYQQIWRLRMR